MAFVAILKFSTLEIARKSEGHHLLLPWARTLYADIICISNNPKRKVLLDHYFLNLILILISSY